jgi:predicted peptidase
MHKIVLSLSAVFLLQSSQAQDLSQYEKKEFVRDGKTLPYRILYPTGYDRHNTYPLIVFLHGAGQRGNNNESQLETGGSLFLRDSLRKNYPAIVIFPQCPVDSSWAVIQLKYDQVARHMDLFFPFLPQPTQSARLAKELMDSLVAAAVVDAKRIYIGGLSMGGIGTFDMLQRYPDFFAAGIAICGGGDTAMAKRFAGKIPLWIFHGGADALVNPEHSRRYFHVLQMLGAEVKYTEYPGVGHNSWDKVFVEKDLLHWLFSNKKK